MSIGSFLTKIRKQTAVYWGPGTPDGKGSFSFPSPVEVDCRWEDKAMEFVDRDGNQAVSSSYVIVDQEMAEGGYLKQGDLDSATPDSPIGDEDAHMIRKFNVIPDLRNTAYLYEAFL